MPVEQSVTGDRVRLDAGDIVPADLRLLSSKDLFISQSALTRESGSVETFRGGSARAGAAIRARLSSEYQH